MACMKDYGKTWSYDGSHLYKDGVFGGYQYVIKRGDPYDTNKFMEFRFVPFPKYRKVANQHGVCKFIRVNP